MYDPDGGGKIEVFNVRVTRLRVILREHLQRVLCICSVGSRLRA
jgi:hypothetical protein